MSTSCFNFSIRFLCQQHSDFKASGSTFVKVKVRLLAHFVFHASQDQDMFWIILPLKKVTVTAQVAAHICNFCNQWFSGKRYLQRNLKSKSGCILFSDFRFHGSKKQDTSWKVSKESQSQGACAPHFQLQSSLLWLCARYNLIPLRDKIMSS